MTGNLMQSSAMSSGGWEGKLTSCIGSGEKPRSQKPRRLYSGGTVEQAFVRVEVGNVETMRSRTVYMEALLPDSPV